MFHPFRHAPKRKVNASPSSSDHYGKEASSKPTKSLSPLRLFASHHHNTKETPHVPLLDDCDSSIDMSIYTSESRSTVQYTGNNVCCMTFNPWISPSPTANKRSLTEPGVRLWVPASSPNKSPASTAPSTPEADPIVPTTAKGATTKFTFDEEQKNDYHAGGPIDLDELVPDDTSYARVAEDNSWVMSPQGMASPALYGDEKKTKHVNATSTISSQPFVVTNEEDEYKNSPFVWTDEDDEHNKQVAQSQRRMSDEESAIIDQSYHQTMKSLSMRSLSTNPNSHEEELGDYHFDDSESGSVLLTRKELQLHLDKVQNKEPLPSSCIRGYDLWKGRKEDKKRYFDRLQKKAQEQERLRKYTEEQSNETTIISPVLIPQRSEKYKLYDDVTLATRGQMDQSVDSSIPTVAEDSPGFMPRRHPKKPEETRKKPSRFRLLPKFHSKKKKSPTKESKEPTALPSKQFTRSSEDDPSEAENFSLAPLSKMESLSLGSVLYNRDDMSVDGAKSHDLDCEIDRRPKQLAKKFLEEERRKHRQAEFEKEEYERKEQERIHRLKEKELKRQRELNMKPPHIKSPPRAKRLKENELTRQRESNMKPPQIKFPPRARSYSPQAKTMNDFVPLRITQSKSFSSKVSSIQSQSTTLTLSPCVICDAAERTHMAMPCMHFYFCQDCVEKMNKAVGNSICPVCSRENVAFARVLTGC